jgi:HAD superfamily hydrolase (TIGR01509 family)
MDYPWMIASKEGRGLFLDLDGTLAISLGAMRTAFDQFMESHELVSTDEAFEAMNGPPLEQIVINLKQAHGLEEPREKILSQYRQLIENVYHTVSPAPGAEQLLRTAREAGWTRVVVTSNERMLAERWLERVGLRQWVDFIIGGDDVRRGKPSPDPYILAIEQGECQAAHCVAVEDSRQGAESALAAGLLTFGIGAEFSGWPTGVRPVADLTEVEAWISSQAPVSNAPKLIVHAFHPGTGVFADRASVRPLDADLDEKVEELWQKEIVSRGEALFNGTIYCVDQLTPDHIEGHFVEYRQLIAQRMQPAMFTRLGIRPLAVSGLLKCWDGVIFGRRPADVTSEAGMWELVPSGGVDHTSEGPDGRLDYLGQLLSELSEEIGLSADALTAITPFCLIEDSRSRVFDIGINLETPLSFKEIQQTLSGRHKDEYLDLVVVPTDGLAVFGEEHKDTLVPVSRKLLEIAFNKESQQG